MSQPKVYEFAKEVGIETLVLMDKIRKWELPVKSHMAELGPEVVDQIKEKLAEEANPKRKVKKKAKKAATKKATTKKTAAKKKTTTKKKVAKKATTKKVASAKEAEVQAPAKATVIRRKKVEPVPEPEVPEVVAIAAEPLEASSPKEVSESTVAVVETAVETVAVVEAAVESPVVVAAPLEAAPVEAAPTPSIIAKEVTTPVTEPETIVEVQTVAPAKPAAPPEKSIPRKREVLMTEKGPVSGVKSERPRRNIIGKMDLSRVKPRENTQRPQRTSTRNVRPGFVAQTPVEMPPPATGSYAGRKDRDKKRKVMAPAPTSPSSKDKEQTPPTFVSSEFKKREVVFQPKKKRVVISGNFKKTEVTMPAAHKRVVKVHGSMTAGELAQAMGMKAPALVRALMKNGIMGNINTVMDFETISLVVGEFKYEAENILKTDNELLDTAAFGELDAERVTRSPVVTVMGHVDHGKTTLLDCIRKTRVVDGEAGGITQHVGAYRVQTAHGEITFIDTPGHAAFTEMRARGASSTDIVILVVAAEDGAMPQTIEAINHSKAAGVPIVVAINKMDKPDANPDKIKQQLGEFDLVPEEWGGTTMFCPVSALKGDGVAELLDQVSLQAEVLELKANPKRSATGIVIESRVEKGRGNVATILVQDGTLISGQHLVVGEIAARARQIFDETGKVIKEAGPSCPVEVIGLPQSPKAGDQFDVCKDEKSARKVSDARKAIRVKTEMAEAKGALTLDQLFSRAKMGEIKELAIVLKTDVSGTGEAIRGMFAKLSTDEVSIKVIHSAVGGISESDVLLAATAKGIVVGFNTRPDNSARNAARSRNVDIKTYTIVYELVDEMKAAMSGLLDPDIVQKDLGRVSVREVFTVPKMGTIAGCFVTDGKVNRNAQLRLVRDGKVVYTGKISSLRRFKDDVKEVSSGYECGLSIENFNDIKVGDEIEAFVEEEVAREL